MEHTERKRHIPRIRIDIVFYWILITYLLTNIWFDRVQLLMAKDQINFIENKLLSAIQKSTEILDGPANEYAVPADTKTDKK